MRHIGVVESNLSGSGFEGLRRARALGCHVTFFTSGIERYMAATGGPEVLEECVDEIHFCQTTETGPLLEAVRAVHARRPLDGLFSMAEYEVVVAAEAATTLGLPSPDPDAVRIARNKVLMRRRCARLGVPMPAFRSVDGAEAAARAVGVIGLPCVVKPADETASADVRKCTTVAEVVAHVEKILATRENVRGQRRYHEALVEECVVGQEVSVEVLADGERLHVLGVTDKTVSTGDRFVELGHSFPSQLPADVRDACAEVAVASVRAVGFDLGLAHVEVMLTDVGPRLIEVNPRPAGDRITELVDRSLGTSCLELVVRQYLGEPISADVPAAPARGAAIRFLVAEPGQVVAVNGVQYAAALPGVCEAAVSVEPGSVVGALERNEDRIGHVLAVGDDARAAARIAADAARRVCVRTMQVLEVAA